MSPVSRLLPLVAVLLVLAVPVRGQEGRINWSKDLPTAFAQAKADGKILLICVNAKYVDGRKTEERANKGLREVVYKDARVVAKSREFVCVLFTPSSQREEFGELRMLGIEGAIVSPQHIFVHPDGDKILLREQYWSHGQGEAAVKALVGMMDEAQAKLAGGESESAEPDEPAPEQAPPEGDGRPAWIKERMRAVVDGSRKEREQAVGELLKYDQEGDCKTPLLALLAEYRKKADALAEIIFVLGRDGFVDAAVPIAEFLGHKSEQVRGNAAVSLEYIGSRDKKVVAALLKAAGREKDVSIANHMYRALGRCGVGNAKARSLLLKKCEGSKSEFASYGPTIGLAYFAGDKKAARGAEKILKKIGVPGGRRGGGTNTVKRAVVSWTLASIGDRKSAQFVREELIAKLENVKAFWVEGLTNFYYTVARVCDGDKEALPGVEEGVRRTVGFARGAELGRYGAEVRNLMDEYRKGREAAGFTPKGDYLLGPGRGP